MGVGLGCRLPLDRTPHRRRLFFGRLLAGQDGIEGGVVIEAAVVRQFSLVIEDVNIRRALGKVGVGDFLRFVDEVRKVYPLFAHGLLHRFHRVVGVLDRVVGIDTDELNAFGAVIVLQGDESVEYGFYIRAVVAHKNHHEGFFVGKVPQRITFAIGAGKVKIDGGGAEGGGQGMEQGHDYFLLLLPS